MIKNISSTAISFKSQKSVSEKEIINNSDKPIVNRERLVDTFVKMAKVDTGSNSKVATKQIPSTETQRDFAKILAHDLKEMNLKEIEIDENCILTATLPGNMGNDKNLPVIGLIAHLDTNEDVPTGPVKPQIHDYKDGDINLKGGTVISAEDLKEHKGKTIITSDGKTLLGADDKAGIAEIIESVRIFNEHPELKHPKIRIAFTPDEETGMGSEKFDIKKFGADVAYTVDGSSPSEVENENFNAFNPVITIKGKNVHCGYAYGKMINSIGIANEFIAALPKDQKPETTRGWDGYYHVDSIKGDTNKTTIEMLVRDFDYKEAQNRVKFLRKVAKNLRKKYPDSKIKVVANESYHNMKEKIDELPEVVDFAREGIKRTGLIPESKPIRGGTDGAALSLKNLLTPNLGAGGVNFHSKNEFVPVEDMVKCTKNILNTISVWAEKAKQIAPKIKERRETIKFD